MSATFPKRLYFWSVILVSVVALAASALLLVDYIRPLPVFCGAEGGCGAAKRSVFAHPLGVPLPVFGIAGLLAVAVLALVPGRRARLAQAAASGIGALAAIGLIGWQVAHGSICPYCVTVDVATVVLAVLSALGAVKGWDPPAGRLPASAAAFALVLAVLVPTALGFTKKPLPEGVPEVILAEMAKTPRGKVTVIDFVDYECPFCRATHEVLAPFLRAHADKIRLVRKNVPLRMHPHAMDAAKGAHCAEVLGKGDAMADALMTAPVPSLTPDGIAALAKDAAGLPAADFTACVQDPKTEAAVREQIDTFRAAKGHGLPTLWFDTLKLEGAQGEADLREFFDAALRAQ